MKLTTAKRIFVAGHRGMVGSAVCRLLDQRKLEQRKSDGVEVLTASRSELDLTDSASTLSYFQKHRPDVVIFAAAKVGGIVANKTYPVEFLSDNILMAISAIRAAHQTDVGRFLFLGSTCIYPRDCQQPIQEESLLTGPLEPTNEAYALAKISGLKLCQYYRSQYGSMFHSAMPTNLYGPGDNYHPEHSHVLPALIRRFHEAKLSGAPSVTIWGTGSPRREFLYVEDLADALLHLCELDDPPDWVNVGTGIDSTILEVSQMVAKTVGYEGKVETDPSRPDGTPVKCTDATRLHATGWKHQVSLAEGLQRTYQSFLNETQSEQLRSV
ncbi:GDP-L-fucose synthase [Rubripirellula obstinata]|uniref:GDP-L-fucose synthase n=1 Tax=Rubripirellula obstinata TaxID=406547 RepID=A0A5B1CDT3_9BACT|nr:GDP-L-fucose synthase [Rubripirellula obstinata]KAA1257623.1 GDP-L-fucose synthase [Rubripirellula obstinata]